MTVKNPRSLTDWKIFASKEVVFPTVLRFVNLAFSHREQTGPPCRTSLAGVDDVAACNLAFVHHVIDLLEFTHTDDLERCIDEATAEEINGLARVLAVAHVGTFDGLHADDGFEDWCAEVRTGWETDGDDGSAGPQVLGCLLEWLLVDRDQNDGVGSETVFGGSLHVFDDV